MKHYLELKKASNDRKGYRVYRHLGRDGHLVPETNYKDSKKEGYAINYIDNKIERICCEQLWGGRQLMNKNKLKQRIYKYLWRKFYQRMYLKNFFTIIPEDIDQATENIMRMIKNVVERG